MTKAENFTVRMDAELKQRIKEHPEINWSHIIREHVRSVLDDIERMDQLASDSQLTETDIEDLAAMIDAAAAERARNDLAADERDEGSPHDEEEKDESPKRRDVTDVDHPLAGPSNWLP